MFGIIRPCRNRLGDELRTAWTAHLCGLCLTLRDRHGHAARLVTNYDAVVVSALVEAQTGTDGRRRAAGPCALRGLRRASVAEGEGAQLAAAVSLLLASAKIADHVADGDLTGAVRVGAARRVAYRWAAAGRADAAVLALDADVLLEAVAGQHEAERCPASVLDVTAPTEAATSAAFAHTAVVAGRPANAAPLAEAGRLFGRLAHLLDAVEDLHADHAAGTWNPIVALGLRPAEVRTLCDDAVLGIRLALREVEMVDGRLVHALLVHELATAVERTFATAGQPSGPPPPFPGPPPSFPGGFPPPPDGSPEGQPPPFPPPPPVGWEAPPSIDSTNRSGLLRGCGAWLVLCGTCQVCCSGEWTNPCTGRRHGGWCRGGDSCACSDCDCGDCGDCCGDCGDCDCGGCDC